MINADRLFANEDSYFNRLKTTRYHVTDSLADPHFKFSSWRNGAFRFIDLKFRLVFDHLMRHLLLLIGFFMTFPSHAAVNDHQPTELVKKNDNDYARFLVSEFKKFPASVTHTFVKPQLALKKGTSAYKFRTEITRQFEKENINFAGHWILIVIGCGAGCRQFFLVDGVTGDVTDPKLTTGNGTPYFEAESRLLYVGPGEFKSYEEAMNSASGKPKAWLEESGKLAPHDLKFR